MITRSFLVLVGQLIISPLAKAAFVPKPPLLDSIGVERREGRRYVLHRVDQGQTLFGVARRYRTNVEAIRSANPEIGTGGVRYDQLLRVPIGDVSATKKEPREADKVARKEEKTARKEETAAIRAEETYKPKPATPAAKPQSASTTAPRPTPVVNSNGMHTVESGQTLYSLAARYGVTMAEVRRWNNLEASQGIQVGQTLIMSEKAYQAKGSAAQVAQRRTAPATTETAPTTASTVPAKPSVEVAKLESKPLIAPEPPLAPGSKPKPKEKPATEATEQPAQARSDQRSSQVTERTQPVEKPAEPVAETRPTPKARPTASVRVQSEVGFADVIEGDSPSNKFLALHRSAPVGTLVQVRNDISNQSLYVKVVGKLPDTGLNDQVLIRLSNRAFEKLSPNGQRFRAEVSYTK